MCRQFGVDIHHIIPQAEGGPDSEENAAPLCPSCHSTYGANPEKRKTIREARDLWFELCASPTPQVQQALLSMAEALKGVATKEDIERLAVRNSTYTLGTASGGHGGDRFSFVGPHFVHPLVVRALLGSISRSEQANVAIDLAAVERGSQYYGEFAAENRDGRPWVCWVGPKPEYGYPEHFWYEHVATSPSGIQIVKCKDSGGGSGVFTWIGLFVIEGDRALTVSGGGLATQERVILKTLGMIYVGDRYIGEISYTDGVLRVGPDQNEPPLGGYPGIEVPVR